MAEPKRNYYEDEQGNLYTDWDQGTSALRKETKRRQPFAANTNRAPRNAIAEYESDSTTSAQFTAQQQQRTTDPRKNTDREPTTKDTEKEARRVQRRIANEQTTYRERIREDVQRRKRKTKKKILRRARSGLTPIQKSTAKLRAKAVNRLFWFIIPWFYILQLWAGILMLAFLGLTGFLQGNSVIAWVGNTAFNVVNWLSGIFGGFTSSLNFVEIAFSLVMITFYVILAQALVLVTAAWICYKLVGVSPFEGKQPAWNWILFIGLVIGYCLPVLNLIPWIIPWMWLVARTAR